MLPTLGRPFADVSASMYAVYTVMSRQRASPSGISICSMRGRVNLFPLCSRDLFGVFFHICIEMRESGQGRTLSF